jgi:HD-GYP domain-containing protein (c-di-GMP phosphodiesterase class II)
MLETTILQTLTRAEALNDQSTSDHALRLVPLVEATAHFLHFSKERIRLLTLAARLHDIGKISIPQTVLQKAGPLSCEEWSLMRGHAEVGHSMLLQIGGTFARIAPFVLAHHERWDGAGYPFGLEGEQIPLEARIIAVADSFDAMRNQRSYRKPLSLLEACIELTLGAQVQFDPQVVDAFLASVGEQQYALTPLLTHPEPACFVATA